MKINGLQLGQQLLSSLKKDIRKHSQKPHLAVILVGNDAPSLVYVGQKKKSGKKIGVKVSVHHFMRNPGYQKLAELVHTLSRDPEVHGIIIQRPLPDSISADSLTSRIAPTKDVDSFHPKSPFLPPLGIAVLTTLHYVYQKRFTKRKKIEPVIVPAANQWLKKQTVILLGRGESGGQPIAKTLTHFGIPLIILTSRSEHREEYLKQADIVISAVGKAAVNASELKKDVVLIGVGIRREKKRLLGDYNETDIKKIASYFTPTPKGIGPINVACLLQNVVTAWKKAPKSASSKRKR